MKDGGIVTRSICDRTRSRKAAALRARDYFRLPISPTQVFLASVTQVTVPKAGAQWELLA